jgi:hypothetical protein
MMRVTVRHVLGFLSVWITLLPLPSSGQTTDSHAPPNTEHTKRIEGTVARVDGSEFLLKAKGDTTETYQLSPAVQIVRSRPGQMSDLSPGKFVGCTNLYGESAKLVAGECHIFPDGMHGFAEAHDHAEPPTNSEINGTITGVRDDAGAAQGKGQRILIQISHPGGTTAMPVSSVTIITVLSAGDASALKRGVKVRGLSQQAVDGTEVIQWLTVISADAGKTAAK